jgi:hypothetical protein
MKLGSGLSTFFPSTWPVPGCCGPPTSTVGQVVLQDTRDIIARKTAEQHISNSTPTPRTPSTKHPPDFISSHRLRAPAIVWARGSLSTNGATTSKLRPKTPILSRNCDCFSRPVVVNPPPAHRAVQPQWTETETRSGLAAPSNTPTSPPAGMPP